MWTNCISKIFFFAQDSKKYSQVFDIISFGSRVSVIPPSATDGVANRHQHATSITHEARHVNQDEEQDKHADHDSDNCSRR